MRARPWLIQLALLTVVFLAVNGWQTRSHLRGEALPGGLRPTLSGGVLDLHTLVGRPTLVAVWAPWCSVCAASSSNLRWVQRIVGARAQVVSIAMAYEDVGSVRRYVEAHRATYPVVLGDSALADALHVTAFPTLYFLDAQGRVKHSSVGYTTAVGMLARLVL